MDTAFLFDAPGPRAARRTRVATVACSAALAAVAAFAVWRLGAHGELAADHWAAFTTWPIMRYLLTALLGTVQAALVAGALALPVGAVLALARLSRLRPIRLAATGYIELFRAVPLLLLIYVFLLALPAAGVRVPVFWQLVLAVSIHHTAVFAEVFRAGVLALDRGQTEAALSIGLTHGQAMRLVVIPQALRNLAPSLVSQVVTLLKDTTLGYVVSYPELLESARVLGEYTGNLLPTYLVIAALFIVVNLALTRLAHHLEKRRHAHA
ncbi:MAG TPA: amino acid ABC transporter permease [Streptosporangiaceae bacterium]